MHHEVVALSTGLKAIKMRLNFKKFFDMVARGRVRIPNLPEEVAGRNRYRKKELKLLGAILNKDSSM